MAVDKWIKDRREFFGKKMIPFNFKRFMDEKQFSVEDIAKLSHYSIEGTMIMLARGTMKEKVFQALQQVCPDVAKFRGVTK